MIGAYIWYTSFTTPTSTQEEKEEKEESKKSETELKKTSKEESLYELDTKRHTIEPTHKLPQNIEETSHSQTKLEEIVESVLETTQTINKEVVFEEEKINSTDYEKEIVKLVEDTLSASTDNASTRTESIVSADISESSTLTSTLKEQQVEEETHTIDQTIDLIASQVVADNSNNLDHLANVSSSNTTLNDISSDELTEFSSDETSERLCNFFSLFFLLEINLINLSLSVSFEL